MSSGCAGGCAGCGGACEKSTGPKVEKESCRSCPNRQRCHGQWPEVTQQTVIRLIEDTVREVVLEWEASGRLRSR